MWNIKKITILLCFLSLVAFISCSAEDKTGSPKPEGETEITGETCGGSGTGESGSGGSEESGSGSGGGTGESGGSGESGGGTGGTETTEEGNFPPPVGKYRDGDIWDGRNDPYKDTEVSTVDGKTTIKGMSMKGGGGQMFGFDISKWKKTTKGEKITKLEAVDIVVETDYTFIDISIIYDNDTQTLKITFKDAGAVCLFNGTKQP